jgi:hypothetical protein
MIIVIHHIGELIGLLVVLEVRVKIYMRLKGLDYGCHLLRLKKERLAKY